MRGGLLLQVLHLVADPAAIGIDLFEGHSAEIRFAQISAVPGGRELIYVPLFQFRDIVTDIAHIFR